LLEVERELENPDIWNDAKAAQSLSKERISLSTIIDQLQALTLGLADAEAMLELIIVEQDEVAFNDLVSEVERFRQTVEGYEFRRMFNGDMDVNSAFLDIQSGSGGTEAQDWAEMLLRMYLRWGEAHGFKTTITEVTAGDVAGIKGATIHIEGEYAFGWLRTETGVHRLVRKSPFDSGNRRHTSFASVFISPEVDDNFEVELNMSDVRVDTYRASGAGGQHVNKTDSAVRMTHLPTGAVVQCQSGRSQHQNKDQALKQLKSKLYELEMQKKNSAQQALEDSKSEITWGSQIRSYILDDSRVKDLRTNVETRNTQSVLDGGLDLFINAALKANL
jgi:peptide chain release factor 2